MGLLMSRLWKRAPKDTRLLMIGLDSAGKTTILYKLKLGDIVNTIPTVGFNVETIVFKDLRFTVWDVGGQDKIRPLWRHYFQNTSGMIYVVDSNDRDRIEEAARELRHLLNEEELKNIVLLILANKQDLPNAMTSKELSENLHMSTFRNIQWHIQQCCAVNGNGLSEGLDWLSSALNKRKK